MQWDKFKDQFHESWWSKIKPFIESSECDQIYAKLKEMSKRGVQIAPLSNLTFRAFKETPFEEVKVILLGFCPYATFYQGSPIADGLAFSCSVTNKIQPSLETMYNGWEESLYNGLNLDYYKNPDLLYLSKQGVLLLNSSLTVSKDKPGSHNELWKPFTKYLLEKVFAYTDIPIVIIGKDAKFYERYITPITHGQSFYVEHPSFAARNQSSWDIGNTFQKVNSVIKANGHYPVDWLVSKEEAQRIIDLDFLPF